jgi:hypothetical protein
MIDRLAHRMFTRRCELDGFDMEDAEFEWMTDPGIRDFWLAEAGAVLDYLRTEGAIVA